LYGLNTRLPVPGLVIVGALAAATGRMLLAHGFRLLAGRLSDKTTVFDCSPGVCPTRRSETLPRHAP
jgi:hypothetical protein